MFRIFVTENKKIMETVRQIQKFGDNLGVCFPQVIVNKLSLREGF